MSGVGRGRGGISRQDGFGDWINAQSGVPRFTQSPRGGLRGRGFPSTSGYNTNWRTHRQSQAPPVNILDDLVLPPIQTISDPSTANVGDIVPKDVQYHGSYTWTNAKVPTMIVPGSPRVWHDKSLPYTVPPDTGETYAYSNSLKMPSSPLLPIFRAVDHIESQDLSPARPKLDWSSIDFITDRNNLRKLLTWIESKDTGGRVDDFRIDLQLCGLGTVLMQRWEPRAVYASENSGFGDSFEKESTSPGPGCDEGLLAGHNRIISYTIHRTKLLIRCEVDACILEDTEQLEPPSETEHDAHSPAPKPQSADASPDDLADALSSLSVSIPSTASAATDIKIVKGGIVVPQASLIKIKTRSKRNVQIVDWTGAYIQLFLGQTYSLYLGVHQRGTFDEVRKLDFDSPEFQEAAKSTQSVLKKLGRLLDEILYITMEYGHKGRLSVVCKAGQLKMYERQNQDSFLPEDVLARFESGQEDE